MKQVLLLIFLIYPLVANDYSAQISPITKEVKTRMLKGNAWRKGCPVGLEDLRYVRVHHWDFKGKSKTGELVIHKDVAQSVVSIFEELYAIKYPVRQMRLVSDFNGNDWQSIEADNTSAHNCRSLTGSSKKWSNHAYGMAIDLNPIENPYISRTGHIAHKASLQYRKRVHILSRGRADKAVALKDDKVVQIFKKYGWKWGGDWKGMKDYQHFSFREKVK